MILNKKTNNLFNIFFIINFLTFNNILNHRSFSFIYFIVILFNYLVAILGQRVINLLLLL